MSTGGDPCGPGISSSLLLKVDQMAVLAELRRQKCSSPRRCLFNCLTEIVVYEPYLIFVLTIRITEKHDSYTRVKNARICGLLKTRKTLFPL